ncbi:outer membrane protein assembly factor BamB family protein [Haladaptatus salinisoli]|uniref:outer membrane protein assembly factor BamB family protein n=1 Tax=Haladaptatus salinisoli TaxID=2884876 RepID=UPI001D0A6683|nr:PQQ-binding-like beta-propeller repeat protein [Haladaptatus salinisoli]
MPSRRDVLAAAGIAGLGVGAVSRLRLGPVESWTPRPDTWPLRRYDPANTAANPDATPPTNPSVAWAVAPLGVSRDNAVVVDQETAYAAGNGIAALNRTDGTVRWRSDRPGGPLAVRDGTTFIAPGYDVSADGAALRAIGTDGVERWSRKLEAGNVDSLVVADDTLFVGGQGILRAYGTDGRQRWSTEGGPQTHVLVSGGRLHASTGSVARYRRRSLLSVGIGSPGETAWETDYYGVRFGYPTGLAATDSRLVAGFWHSMPYGGSALVGVDPRGGTVRWSAFPFDDDAEMPLLTGALATDTANCFFGFLRGEGENTRYAVASRRLSDGGRRWHHTVEQRITDIAVVAETVVVATAAPDGATEVPFGTVRALRSRDGSEMWRVDFDDYVRSIAPVDGAVFAATLGGQVIALE